MEKVRVTVEFTMPESWASKFMQMLDCMRWFSRTGGSRTVAFYADGDGDFSGFDFKLNGHEVTSDIDWREYDKPWPVAEELRGHSSKELPPPFKTKRYIDFFFSAE